MTDKRWALPDAASAVEWCKNRNSQGIRCTLDVLGPYARLEDQVSDSVESYLNLINLMKTEGLNASLSLKLTTLGATFDRDLCRKNVLDICEEASSKGVEVDIDMESWSFVKFTLDTALLLAERNYSIMLALQAYLDRTPSDMEVVLDHGIMVRLVKGAYSGDIADFHEIQDRFKSLAQVLLESGRQFEIGTHDPELLAWMKKKAIDKKEFVEFGFLKGFSDITKEEMVKQGWKVLEYVPFGKTGAAYDARRLNYLKRLERLGRAPAP